MSHEPAPFPMREPPRVAVVSDDPLVRAAFHNLLGAADAVLEVVEDTDQADLLLWDAGIDADRTTERLAELAALGRPAVALLEDADHATEALASGARGVVLRGTDGARLTAALIAAHYGLTVVDASFSEALLPDPPPVTGGDGEPALTAREREVLRLVADGLSNKRIAKELAISEHTAKFHVNSILGKLDARTRTEAVVTAARRGLILL